jgi:hypothetical protein
MLRRLGYYSMPQPGLKPRRCQAFPNHKPTLLNAEYSPVLFPGRCPSTIMQPNNHHLCPRKPICNRNVPASLASTQAPLPQSAQARTPTNPHPCFPAAVDTAGPEHCPAPFSVAQHPDAQSALLKHCPVINCFPAPLPTFSAPGIASFTVLVTVGLLPDATAAAVPLPAVAAVVVAAAAAAPPEEVNPHPVLPC